MRWVLVLPDQRDVRPFNPAATEPTAAPARKARSGTMTPPSGTVPPASGASVRSSSPALAT